MFVRKEHAGASSHGFDWPEDGSVVEVPDRIGGDLLDHAPREFADVTEEWLAAQAANEPEAAGELEPGAAEPSTEAGGQAGGTDEAGDEASGDADTSADAALEKPKRKYTRRTPVTE